MSISCQPGIAEADRMLAREQNATSLPTDAGRGVKTRVYVVDSDALIRRGLVSVIGAEPDMEVCGDSGNAALAFHAIVKLQPDVVTIEIWLKDKSGLELAKSIRAVNPEIGVLALSRFDETVYAIRVLKAGARGFVSKQDDANKVLHAIRRVRDRHLFVSEGFERRMLSRIVEEDTVDGAPVSALSDRELEIGNLIGSGLGTREIAARLCMSVKTVDTHRAHLKRKLGLCTSTGLVHFWVRWVEERAGQNTVYAHPVH